jgi:hypothetical protein
MDQAINKIEEIKYKNNIRKSVECWENQGKRSNVAIVNNQFRIIDGRLVQVVDPALLKMVKRTVVPSVSEIIRTEAVAEENSAVALAEVVAEQ